MYITKKKLKKREKMLAQKEYDKKVLKEAEEEYKLLKSINIFY